PGGASKETWSFSVVTAHGSERRLILRADRTAGGPGLATEADVLRAAHRAGVPVPAVVVSGDGSDGIGVAYMVVEFIDGETIARRILRDDEFEAARGMLAAQCGTILARIHEIPVGDLAGLSGADPLPQLRSQLDQLGQPHPAFELGLLWLAEHQPERRLDRFVHGDFRNGNLIVGPEGIRAVLDWELAHLGDPVEDLAWLCVKAWRFGSAPPVGGFGEIDDLVGAYEAAGGETVDRDVLHWWIVEGTLHWGVICIAQAFTHRSGAFRSVELAAIGRRVCEVESDLLELLPWGSGTAAPSTPPSGEADDGAPHDVPTAVELLDAVHEFLASDAVPATEGRIRFHLRVAANVVAMVGRQIELGPAQRRAHEERLGRLDVRSEAELATAIRSGDFAGRLAEVTDAVRATVADKLSVANPRY
ncbi:MAG: phosphotransferase family protein, partial [Acidimicrobiales bacterium]